ncbi:MAG: DUF2203 domain-containing protein [Firmicutes bacterium]|nr:DUF2203 domain-containing protein [Alicyclobacillaceae bacterium]MCL6496542.1 DUF2203 domain-containing protein [Bacillota bacterium]
MAVRYFTVSEANQLIPALRTMLQRLKALQEEARRKYEEMRDIREVGYRRDGNLIMLADYQRAKQDFDRLVADANQLLGEINQMGCRVTDVEMGLVDFPAKIAGVQVYLCWQMQEPEVAYYHGLHEGFAGRRPLNPVRPS